MPARTSHARPTPRLVGTWRLVSYVARDSTGGVQFPFGERVSGQLVYDSAGHMSAHVMSSDRPFFAGRDPVRGSDAEVREAFTRHVSYFGTYTIDSREKTVTHHVQGASFPNWVGSDQVRFYRLDGARLTLSTPPIELGGQALEFALIWERIP